MLGIKFPNCPVGMQGLLGTCSNSFAEPEPFRGLFWAAAAARQAEKGALPSAKEGEGYHLSRWFHDIHRMGRGFR